MQVVYFLCFCLVADYLIVQFCHTCKQEYWYSCTLSTRALHGCLMSLLLCMSAACIAVMLVMQGRGQNRLLCISNSTPTFARQKSVSDRQAQEDKQQTVADDREHLKQRTTHVKLKVNAQATESAVDDAERQAGGTIHVALESWISRATAKARAKLRE